MIIRNEEKYDEKKLGNIFSKIVFVNALTRKEMSHLNEKYFKLGLFIKQVVVDNYGNEIPQKERSYKELLGKKRERKEFNSMNNFLNKYYGEEELSALNKKLQNFRKKKDSDGYSVKKYTKGELAELINALNSIEEDCNKIEYKICKYDTTEFKSKIVEYILKFKKYITRAQYGALFNKWKSEVSKLKGVDLFDYNTLNDLSNWKTSILKAFKSEITLNALCNILDKLIKGKNKEDKEEEKKSEKEDKKEDEGPHIESSDSDSSENSLEEDQFNKYNALLLQLEKNARNDEENLI